MRFDNPGLILYRCRLCGVVFEGVHAPKVFICLLNLLTGTKQPWSGNPVATWDIHSCFDGRIGVGDVVGCKEDEDEND